MTSTPYIILTKRSALSSDRPNPGTVQQGEAAISYGSSDPGLYIEDSAGAIRKVGPNHYGTTAPNSTPVGLAGNSVGETWVDSSTSYRYMTVWDGSAWRKIGAQFSDSSAIASGAIQASGCVLASGAFTALIASGCVLASGSRTAILSSGTLLASGSFTSILSSGTIVASGLPITTSLPVASTEGTLMYQAAAPSGLYIYVGGAWVQV
jgi:hypothetical protein